MGKTCCLTFCQETDKDKSKATKFHLFPLNKSYCKKWIDYVHKYDNKDFVATQYSVICSKHFKKTDYETLNGRRTLRAGAYPRVINKVKSESTTPSKIDATNELISSSLSSTSSTNSNNTSQDSEKKKNKLTFALGGIIEAKDLGTNIWYTVRILEVDWVEKEILIHPENKPQGFDEWVPMDSPRLRPKTQTPKNTRFVKGEQVLATWIDGKKYPAVVQEVHLNERYEIVYFDGIRKTVKSSKLTKLSQTDSSIQLPETKKKTLNKKLNLLPREKYKIVYYEGMKTGERTLHKKIVRKGLFKKKKNRLENNSTKDIPSPSNSSEGSLSAKKAGNGLNTGSSQTKKIKTISPIQRKPSLQTSPNTPTSTEHIKIENDQVFRLGKIAIQKKDHSFICPKEGCGKLLRNENILLMHLKHSHTEYNDMLGSTPNVADLAYARTVGQSLYIENRSNENVTQSSPTVLTNVPINSSETNTKEDSRKKRLKENIDNKESMKEIIKESTGIKTLYPVHRQDTSYGSCSPLSPEQVLEMQEAERRASTSDLKKTTLLSPSEIKEEKRTSGKRYFPDYVTDTNLPKKRKVKDTRTEISSIDSPDTLSCCSDTSSFIKEENNTKINIKQEENVDDSTLFTPIIQSNKDSESDLLSRDSPDHLRKEEVIHCKCGYEEEDGLMIQCDICLCWQHGACMAIEKDCEVPEKYFCNTCKNPYRGRLSSLRFLNDQEWLNRGRLPSLNFPNPKVTLSLHEKSLLDANTHVSKDLLETYKMLRNIRKKINVSRNKDHPKLYYWNDIWMSPKEFSTLYQDKIKHQFNDSIKNSIESTKKPSTTLKKSISSLLAEKLLHTSSSTLNNLLIDLLCEDESSVQKKNLEDLGNGSRKKYDDSLMGKRILSNFTSKIFSPLFNDFNEKINKLNNDDSLNKKHKLGTSPIVEIKKDANADTEILDNSLEISHKNQSKISECISSIPIKEEKELEEEIKNTKEMEIDIKEIKKIKDNKEIKDILKKDNKERNELKKNIKETIELENDITVTKELKKDIKETKDLEKHKKETKNNSANKIDNDKVKESNIDQKIISDDEKNREKIDSDQDISKEKESNKTNTNKNILPNKLPSPNVVSLRSKSKNSLDKLHSIKEGKHTKKNSKKSLLNHFKNSKSYNTRYKSNEDNKYVKESNLNLLRSVKSNSSDNMNLKKVNSEEKEINKTNSKTSSLSKNNKIRLKNKKKKSLNSDIQNKEDHNILEKDDDKKSLKHSSETNSNKNSKKEQKMGTHLSESNLSKTEKDCCSEDKSLVNLKNLSIKNLNDLYKYISAYDISTILRKDLFCNYCIVGRYYKRRSLTNQLPFLSPNKSQENKSYHKEKKKINEEDLEEESCFSDDSTSSLISEDLCNGHLNYVKAINDHLNTDFNKLKDKSHNLNEKITSDPSKESDKESNLNLEQMKNDKIQKSHSSLNSSGKVHLEKESPVKIFNGKEEKDIIMKKSEDTSKEIELNKLLSSRTSTNNDASALIHQILVKNNILSNSKTLKSLKTLLQRSSNHVRLTRSNKSQEELWEENKNTIPHLYKIAMVVLGATPTQVSVERAFSGLKFILRDNRNSLNTNILEDILIIREQTFPIPERMIDSNECRLHLIMHIEQEQLILNNNLKQLEDRLKELENRNLFRRSHKYGFNGNINENKDNKDSNSIDVGNNNKLNNAKIIATTQLLFNDLKKIQDFSDVVQEDLMDNIR